MDQRLRKSERIKRSLEVQKVRSKGKRFFVKPFVIFFYPNTLGRARMAVGINRKSGNSVQRVRAKRKIRDVFRKNKALFASNDYYFYTTYNLSELKRNDWKVIIESIVREVKRNSVSIKQEIKR